MICGCCTWVWCCHSVVCFEWRGKTSFFLSGFSECLKGFFFCLLWPCFGLTLQEMLFVYWCCLSGLVYFWWDLKIKQRVNFILAMKCKRNIDICVVEGRKKIFNPLVFMIATFSLTEILTTCHLDVKQQHLHVQTCDNAGLFFIIATFISLNVLKCYCNENHIFSIEAILRQKQVACMRRKMLFTIFKSLFLFQRYSSF